MTAYNEIRYNNPYANAGSLILLSTQTASASASISFTSGIDSTYKEYMFIFNNIHPANSGVNGKLTFNLSTYGGSSYNVTKTTTFFEAGHSELDAYSVLAYEAGNDLAQSTSYQDLARNTTNANDDSLSGYLHLFNPSSNVYVKHFTAITNTVYDSNVATVTYIAGYGNTTSAVNAIDFKCSSGNIDDGTIQMFGVVS